MSGLENKFSVFLVCEDVVYGALLRKNITYKELVGYVRKKFSINHTFDISFHYEVGSSVVRIDDDNDVEFFGNEVYNSLATTSHKLFVKKDRSAITVGEPSSWVRPDSLQVVKPPNMNFRTAGRPKNTDRIKSQGEEPIQVGPYIEPVTSPSYDPDLSLPHYLIRNYMKWFFCASYNLISDIGSVTDIVSVVTQVVVAVVVVKGEDAPLECVRTHSDSTQPRLKRSRETRQESNIHVDLGRHSQEYEAGYTNNYVRSQEYEVAYTNNYVRSQEYEAAYANNYVRSQEYEATYTNNYVRSQ
ncbi:hypothetical protein Tco_0763086 [Tanacetum coccineum]